MRTPSSTRGPRRRAGRAKRHRVRGHRHRDATAAVDAPRLWSTDSPDLYTLRAEVLRDGAVDDSYDHPSASARSRSTPAGFSLNGKPLKLQGVDLHHDLGALGSAISADAVVRQMRS